MSNYSYPTILKKAKMIKKGVEEQYKLTRSSTWSYYIAKQILNPRKDVKKIMVTGAKKSEGDGFSRQVPQVQYKNMANSLVEYVETKNQLPNNLKIGGKVMKVEDYTYMFSRIIVYYDEHKILPKQAEVNSKAFTKPTETPNKVYDYFVKKFGKITCIDDALEKIAGRGYGYYYDDCKTNIQTIDAMASSTHTDDPNCTDATQAIKNVADGTKKYKKVDCVHVKCSGGDGHVFLKITQKDGSVFYRDPAAVLSKGYVTAIWCKDGTILGINPSWWMSNLHR